jgi:Zinc knuckle
MTIPSSDEDFDKLSKIGKEKSRIIELNEIPDRGLILSIDAKTSDGKIMELENLRARLETMHSSISENQCMIHILNNLTSDYELQLLAMMEGRVGDIERPVTVEEIRGELSLRFERLNVSKAEGNVLEEHALFGGQFKGKCRNCGQLGHKSFQCKIAQSTRAEITVIQVVEFCSHIVARQGMTRRIVSS